MISPERTNWNRTKPLFIEKLLLRDVFFLNQAQHFFFEKRMIGKKLIARLNTSRPVKEIIIIFRNSLFVIAISSPRYSTSEFPANL
jgi:hypothetical protein